jgi:hypothetical protein
MGLEICRKVDSNCNLALPPDYNLVHGCYPVHSVSMQQTPYWPSGEFIVWIHFSIFIVWILLSFLCGEGQSKMESGHLP